MKTRFRTIAFATLATVLGSSMGLAQDSSAPEAATNYVMLPALDNSSPETAVLLGAADSGERLLAVGARGLIIWSEDQGESWQQASVPVSLTLTSVFFADPEHGWATGHEGLILATTDGGENWKVQQTGLDTVKQSIPMLKAEVDRLQTAMDATEDAEQKDLIAFDLEYAQFALEDAETALIEGSPAPMLDIWFRNAREGYAVGAYGAFLGTTDGGENWRVLSPSLENPDKLHLNRITGSEDGTLYIVGEAGLAFRSTDSGANWEKLAVPYDGSLFGVLTPGADEIVVHGLRGNILISRDKGDSWENIESDSEKTLIGSRTVDGMMILVGASGTVLQSDKDGSQLTDRFHPGRSTLSAVIPLEGEALLLVGTDGIIKIDSFDSLEEEH